MKIGVTQIILGDMSIDDTIDEYINYIDNDNIKRQKIE